MSKNQITDLCTGLFSNEQRYRPLKDITWTRSTKQYSSTPAIFVYRDVIILYISDGIFVFCNTTPISVTSKVADPNLKALIGFN